jgi:hypothetical protein
MRSLLPVPPSRLQALAHQSLELEIVRDLRGVVRYLVSVSVETLGEKPNQLILIREVVREVVQFRVNEEILRGQHGMA